MKRKVKVIKKEKTAHSCYFCGKTTRLEQHHVIFKRFLVDEGLENNKEWICKSCHKKLHQIMQPLVTILLTAIEKLQPHEHKVGFIWKNGKHVGKGGK